MKLVIERRLKELTTEEVLDKNGKRTGKTKEVETGEEVLEQKQVPLVDYKQNKEALVRAGWQVVAEANIIDLKEQKYFEASKKKVEY